MKKCSATELCEHLENRLDGGFKKKGFAPLLALDERSLEKAFGENYLYAVAYRTDAKDYGLIINYCPWCGGRPGRVHAGKEQEQ